MSNKWSIFGALTLLAVLVAMCLVVVLKIEIAPNAQKPQAPVRKQNFGEGIRFSQHGLIGVDLVSIGRAHMRKLRRGPFTIGAINELVLEDVSIALPEDDAIETIASTGKGDGAGSGDGAGKDAAEARRPKAMLARLGINTDQIRMGAKIPRFSALSVKRIRVARIVDGTNAVPWFAADSAKAERYGLVLHNGWSVKNGVTNVWKDALLRVDNKIELIQ